MELNPITLFATIHLHHLNGQFNASVSNPDPNTESFDPEQGNYFDTPSQAVASLLKALDAQSSNSEFDEHTGHGSDDPRRLELWCLTTHIPGTVIPLRILYLCAITEIGGFAHWCYAVDDPDEEHISNYINDLWFARHDLLKDARHAHARRFAKR